MLHSCGVYVLGAMDAAERAAFEEHLDICPSCAREVRRLAGLPGLLAKVPADRLTDPGREPVPETLLPGLLDGVDRTRRRRAWTRAGLAIAAAVALVAGTVVVTDLVRDDGSTQAEMGTAPSPGSASGEPIRMRSRGDGLVTGWVTLTPVAWGTRIDLACSYADGGRPDWTYAMVVRTEDGHTEQVGSWKVGYGEDAAVTLPTSATPDEIKEIDVLTGNGDVVLELKR